MAVRPRSIEDADFVTPCEGSAGIEDEVRLRTRSESAGPGIGLLRLPGQRAQRGRTPLAFLGVMVLAACGALDTSGPPPPSTRPAAKASCDEAVLDSDLVALRRTLVPYGPELLGVETVWGDEAHRVTLVSGGYFDDIFEAYDDLEPVGEAEIRGERATLLSSSFLGRPLWAATWREDAEPPCDAYAIIAIGLDEVEFETELQRIR